MFTITSFADVVAVAKTFGNKALSFAVENNTLSMEANQLIMRCQQWAADNSIEVISFNDGNNCYEITAVFGGERINGQYYTDLKDITIFRTGFGSFELSATDAMNRQEITADSLRYILSEIKARNNAADVLFD